MDPTQESLLKERCYVVDKNDNIIGIASKRDCHMVQKDGDIKLHRGFSVFLFNTKGELLIHKRSSVKITYANKYTNSCCSHPIADVEGEHESVLGIKKAAKRKLEFELGIDPNDLNLDDLVYITRIHYKDTGDGIFGEHEIDYILFLIKDVAVNPNPDEMVEVKYINKAHFTKFIEQIDGQITPWFELMIKLKLMAWWDNLETLEKIQDHKNILRCA